MLKEKIDLTKLPSEKKEEILQFLTDLIPEINYVSYLKEMLDVRDQLDMDGLPLPGNMFRHHYFFRQLYELITGQNEA